jgi:hypothetical protein
MGSLVYFSCIRLRPSALFYKLQLLIKKKERKRYILMVEWCYMYKKNRESVDYLLLHCEITGVLWKYYL